MDRIPARFPGGSAALHRSCTATVIGLAQADGLEGETGYGPVAGVGFHVGGDGDAFAIDGFHGGVPAIDHHQRGFPVEVPGVGLDVDDARLPGDEGDVVVVVIDRQYPLIGDFAAQLHVGHEGYELGVVVEGNGDEGFGFGIGAHDLGLKGDLRQIIEVGEIVAVIGALKPIEVSGQQLSRVALQVELDEVDVGDLLRELQ